MYDKKTKIVCTIGPSSWDPEVMRKMIENGMNVARVNGAFADPAEIDKVTELVRNVSSEVALMIDVKGPEVRMNKFATPITIKPGDEIIIGNTDQDAIYPANYKDVYKYLKPGQRIVIGDGDVEMVLKEIKGDKMYTEVKFGEVLKPGKAMNLPGADFIHETLTEKDIENLKYAIEKEWDFVSASFMRSAADAKFVNEYLKGSHMKLIAKIEDEEGIANIDEILEEVEGIMIARGGLGVELGLEKVPMVQRFLIDKCKRAGKPVITATQMLESMTYNPRPTRAEVNDVALAIIQGSDAVMLSGESSAGSYPVQTVAEMTKIACEIEAYLEPQVIEERTLGNVGTDALTRAAAEMCIAMEEEIDKVIIVSRTGRAARLLGRHSITQPIYAFTTAEYYGRRMMLSKGIHKTFTFNKEYADRDAAIEAVLKEALEQKVVSKDDTILFISKSPLSTPAPHYFPNMFEVVKVGKLIK